MLAIAARPKTWEEFAGHESSVASARCVLADPDFFGGAFWIWGPSGVGKTTFAWLLAREVTGGEDGCVQELDGDRCSVDAVHEIDRTIFTGTLFGAWKIYIVNEAHSMTAKAVQAWLNLLERLPPNRMMIFTTTKSPADSTFGEFTEPLLSRCLVYGLERNGIREPFIRRLVSAGRTIKVALSEGKAEQILESFGWNLRAAQNFVHANRATLGVSVQPPLARDPRKNPPPPGKIDPRPRRPKDPAPGDVLPDGSEVMSIHRLPYVTKRGSIDARYPDWWVVMQVRAPDGQEQTIDGERARTLAKSWRPTATA